jgi:hypothetical protein
MDGQPGSNSISLDHIAFHLLLRQPPSRDEVERCPSCLFVDLEPGKWLENTKLVSYGSDLPDKIKTTRTLLVLLHPWYSLAGTWSGYCAV